MKLVELENIIRAIEPEHTRHEMYCKIGENLKELFKDEKYQYKVYYSDDPLDYHEITFLSSNNHRFLDLWLTFEPVPGCKPGKFRMKTMYYSDVHGYNEWRDREEYETEIEQLEAEVKDRPMEIDRYELERKALADNSALIEQITNDLLTLDKRLKKNNSRVEQYTVITRINKHLPDTLKLEEHYK